MRSEQRMVEAVVDRLKAMFRHARGVRIDEVSFRDAGTPHAFLLGVMEGWGPSLHARRLPIRMDIAQALLRAELVASGRPAEVVVAEVAAMHPLELPPHIQRQACWITAEEVADLAASHLTSCATSQLSLAAAAERRGLAAPLRPPAHADDVVLDHLSIHPALGEVLSRDLSHERILERLRMYVWESVRQGGGSDLRIGVAGPMGAGTSFGVFCEAGVPTIWFEHLITTSKTVSTGFTGVFSTDIASFDGQDLHLPHGLPADVVGKEIGRSVGELATTGVTALDRSIVRRTYKDLDGGLWLEVDADTIPVHELFGALPEQPQVRQRT